ncbi:unnamed protein product [Darwinula stevensoni]|uniref:RNA 3'-terminal phosphate cyclase domain-containing protein n=1 Tax=Darwinula stevensoni TaxID=69355 RepID=A0A7R9A111_9CRUS|nr:unnamed protein product [Darwinula stevensoni]CAG0882454.1 unnamed protein product [Darwinula stevensoni]
MRETQGQIASTQKSRGSRVILHIPLLGYDEDREEKLESMLRMSLDPLGLRKAHDTLAGSAKTAWGQPSQPATVSCGSAPLRVQLLDCEGMDSQRCPKSNLILEENHQSEVLLWHGLEKIQSPMWKYQSHSVMGKLQCWEGKGIGKISQLMSHKSLLNIAHFKSFINGALNSFNHAAEYYIQDAQEEENYLRPSPSLSKGKGMDVGDDEEVEQHGSHDSQRKRKDRKWKTEWLVILMALAKGVSRVKSIPPTLHTRTAIHVVEQLMNVTFKEVSTGGNSVILECEVRESVILTIPPSMAPAPTRAYFPGSTQAAVGKAADRPIPTRRPHAAPVNRPGMNNPDGIPKPYVQIARRKYTMKKLITDTG